jgi:hypothetical protein
MPEWIKGVANGMAIVDVEYANAIFGSMRNVYTMLRKEGWDLPDIDAKSTNSGYLFKVMGALVFRAKITEVRHPPIVRKKWAKIDIVTFIDTQIFRASTELGFGVDYSQIDLG